MGERIGRHGLANINRETATADCMICGPNVKIRVRGRKYPQCSAIERNRERRRKRPPRIGLSRKWRLRGKYGLTVTDYESMAEDQGHACAICFTWTRYKLYVDHCHTTGRVRGLLCASCNTALGLLRDDPALALRVAIYLESNTKKRDDRAG